MSLLKHTIHLIRKDLLLEWRQKYAISGILLYVLSTVFLVYYTVGNRLVSDLGPMQKTAAMGAEIIRPVLASMWSAFFWLIILFASVNAIAKSFVQENSNRQLYYYTLARPTAVILSKIVYNSVLLLGLTFLSLGLFTLVMGNPVQESGLFFLLLFLSSIGLSITFTFISAISAKARNNATLMAILSFPVIIPIVLTLARVSQYALHLSFDNSYLSDIAILLAIDVILISLVLVLFPYLWRD